VSRVCTDFRELPACARQPPHTRWILDVILTCNQRKTKPNCCFSHNFSVIVRSRVGLGARVDSNYIWLSFSMTACRPNNTFKGLCTSDNKLEFYRFELTSTCFTTYRPVSGRFSSSCLQQWTSNPSWLIHGQYNM